MSTSSLLPERDPRSLDAHGLQADRASGVNVGIEVAHRSLSGGRVGGNRAHSGLRSGDAADSPIAASARDYSFPVNRSRSRLTFKSQEYLAAALSLSQIPPYKKAS